jgi:uncharacterized membrane protein
VEIATNILVILHLIGLSSLLGGFLTQMKSLKTGGAIVPAIFHGALTLFITGFALVAMVPLANPDEHVNNLVLAAKTVVIMVIFGLTLAYNKKDLSKAKWVLPTIALLTILNVTLAVMGPIVQSGAPTGA